MYDYLKINFLSKENQSNNDLYKNISKEILQNLEIGQVWQHYKGNHYKILFFTKHSETGEILVVYQRIEDGNSYARPLELFFSTIEFDGKLVPRFILIENNTVM